MGMNVVNTDQRKPSVTTKTSGYNYLGTVSYSSVVELYRRILVQGPGKSTTRDSTLLGIEYPLE